MDGQLAILEENLIVPFENEKTNTHFHAVASNEGEIRRLYWIAFWANIGFSVFEITIGALGYSRLLVIDGLNSGANAIVITMMLFGIHMSHPDNISDEYPYGMGKAQFVATLIVGILLALCASVMFVVALKTFFLPIQAEPVGIGIAVAIISIFGNSLLVYFLRQSNVHYEHFEIKRICRLSSIKIVSSVVLVNSLLLSELLGWFVSERVGSITISLIVVGLSIRIIRTSLDGIMDRSSGIEMETKIKNIVSDMAPVKNVRFVRTRFSGHNLCVDIEVEIVGEYTIRQTDQLVERIQKRLALDMKGNHHVITVDCYPV